MSRTALFALATAALVAQPALAQDAPAPRAPTTPVITDGPELLQAFGGREGLVRIMDDFMVNLLADPRTRPFFEGSDQEQVKRHLVDQFCVIMAGPCTYTGRTMAESHAGMGVNTAQFYALVEALQKSMNKFGVPFRAQNRLLAALAPMHRDIISN